jgi:xylulokinase
VDEVTVGIDIGTTSVKAVAADAGGAILQRARIPHRLHAPRADVFEHDAAQAWSDGVAAAWAQVSAGLEVAAVTVAAMVPSMCAVDVIAVPDGGALGAAYLAEIGIAACKACVLELV